MSTIRILWRNNLLVSNLCRWHCTSCRTGSE